MTMPSRTMGLTACFVLLVSALVTLPASSQATTVDASKLEWWGSTQVGQGYHLRVPVTVHNQRTHPVENGAVFAEVDVASKLIEAGWVSQARSGDDLLRSFELDEASIRVVAMTDLQPMTATSTHGRLGLYTTQFLPGDLRRNEVPSTHFRGALLDADAARFDAKTNPIVTVLWRVPGTLQPGAERSFAIYFDSKTNGVAHAAPDYRGVEGGSLLDRSFWSGPGTDLVGFVTATQRYKVSVIGLHDDTSVKVLLGHDDAFTAKASTSTQPNPFSVDANERLSIPISQNEGQPFRLVADKPILALLDSEGFVPTPAGNLLAKAGESFLFSTTQAGQEGLYFFSENPNRATTAIRLRNLSDGTVQDITLDGNGNPFPYTAGSHLQVDSMATDCHPVASVRTAVIPDMPGTYQADIVSGGPVSLLFEPVQGVTQIPAADGSPAGTRFWTSTSKTTCDDVTQQNQFYAIARAPTDLGVYNTFETPLARLFPTPSCSQEPCGAGQPIGPLPDQAFLRQGFSGLSQIPDRPALVKTGASASLFVGPQPMPPSLASVPLRGPLGGSNAGRTFDGFGSAPPILYALFDDTKVLADIYYAAGQPALDVTINLLGEHLGALPTRTGTSILSYHLESDRPIVVLPRGAAPGFLSGMPVVLDATVHGADYRGHLVEIRSATGLNPVSESTVPGGPVQFPLDIINRGHGAGNTSLADTVDLSVTGKPDGWTVAFSQPNVPLASDQAKRVILTVTPPADAKTDTVTAMTVHATSRGNPRVNHTLEVDTFIKSAYGVGIWFDGVELGGKKVDRGSGPRGGPINYTIYVQNRGTVPDKILLDVTPQSWDAILLCDDDRDDVPCVHGAPVASVDLHPYSKTDNKFSAVRLKLQVTPPDDGTDAFLQTTVTATSFNSDADRDKVFAFSKVSAPSDVKLLMGNRTGWVEPDGKVQFNFTLRNDGAGGAQVFFDLRSDLLPGWHAPQVLRRMPGGDLLAFPTSPPQITLGGRQAGDFAIVATAPSEALAGDQVSMRLQVSTREATLEAFADVIVLPVHRIEPSLRSSTLPLVGGHAASLEVRLQNNGNLDELLTLAPASLPSGWRMTFPKDAILLPRGVTQVLKVELEAPVGVPQGKYDIAVALWSTDGASIEVPFTASVGAFAAHASDGSGRLVAQPGETVWVDHHVRNDGNTPLAISVEAVDGERWPLDEARATYQAPPGANITVPVGWQVPRAAVDGVTEHRARLVLRSDDPSVEALQEMVDVEVDVGRADLAVVQATRFQGPAGQIVRIVVANQGTRTAHDAVVQLLAGDELVDQAVFAELPAQSQRNVTLLQPAGSAGETLVRIDPEDAVVESDSENNLFRLEMEAKATPAPMPGVWMAIGVLLASCWAWRRPPREERTRYG